jgi:hypothetical protein
MQVSSEHLWGTTGSLGMVRWEGPACAGMRVRWCAFAGPVEHHEFAGKGKRGYNCVL